MMADTFVGGSETTTNALSAGIKLLIENPDIWERLKSDQEKTEYISKPKNTYQKYLRKNSKDLLNHKSPNHPDETILKIKNTKPGEPMYPKFKQRIRLNKNNL